MPPTLVVSGNALFLYPKQTVLTAMQKTDKRNTLIDFQRAILIILVITVHIVHFGELHPDVKSSILAFMMPAFLVITGYLVNINKTLRAFSFYILKLALPYIIMVTGYMLLSLYLPVRDGITTLDAETVTRVLLITSIGPYWFFRIMILCGICYYAVLRLSRTRLNAIGAYSLLGAVMLLISFLTPAMDIRAAFYYFVGIGIRLFIKDYSKVCVGSLWSVIPFIMILTQDAWRDWRGVSVVVCVACFISFTTKLETYSKGRLHEVLLYVGRNTLPIYIFHPIFTMMSKYATPFFAFDPTGLLHAIVTIIICIIGSLATACILDRTRLSYVFGYKSLLR